MSPGTLNATPKALSVFGEGAGGSSDVSAVVAVVGGGQETHHIAFCLGDLSVSRSSVLHCCRELGNDNYVNN